MHGLQLLQKPIYRRPSDVPRPSLYICVHRLSAIKCLRVELDISNLGYILIMNYENGRYTCLMEDINQRRWFLPTEIRESSMN